MIRLVYNNKAFKILNEYNITNSSKDVTFNDITIDFTGYTLADTPLKYQEVQIKECADNEDIFTQGKVKFFGYVDDFKFGKMKLENEDRKLTITLLSPRKLATLRSTSIIGTYRLDKAIERIFEPLINDGFIISELNVPDSQILMSYIVQPIETIMNNISKKKNLFWTIDENKNIKVNSLDYLFGQNVAKTIDNVKKEKGLLDIVPQILATDYANVINIKNARLIFRNTTTVVNNAVNEYGGFPIITLPKTIKKGDIIEFNYPVSLSKRIGKQLYEEKDQNFYELITLLEIVTNNFHLEIMYNMMTDSVQTTMTGGTVTYSNQDGSEGTIVLQKDSFFSDLIIGFKYNGENTTQITSVGSESALRYVTMKFMYSAEIEKLKGIISETGQIEKSVDLNETWFTLPELTNYARSMLVENTNNINAVVLEYDEDQRSKVGDLVEINLPNFYVQGKFAVTKIQYRYTNELEQNWRITLQNSDIVSSYIDIFRPEQTQETDTQEYSLIISEFTEEKLQETHIVEEVQDED
ncbi:MAG: hypothetical protein IJH39_11525 [Clostridia bacterium]|nr:hypothetical protein [Clostridia bacterium]